jgi:hypothetical protein
VIVVSKRRGREFALSVEVSYINMVFEVVEMGQSNKCTLRYLLASKRPHRLTGFLEPPVASSSRICPNVHVSSTCFRYPQALFCHPKCPLVQLVGNRRLRHIDRVVLLYAVNICQPLRCHSRRRSAMHSRLLLNSACLFASTR